MQRFQIYLGGANDGFNMKLAAGENLLPGIYTGGNNDGFASTFTASFVYIFTGNGNLNVAANWRTV
ncbi:MAG: hypothetical protein IPP93_08815 [Chitinophagaceae bacterium]|nr:hypothetical protein [Chitinophagaceae bacterium]